MKDQKGRKLAKLGLKLPKANWLKTDALKHTRFSKANLIIFAAIFAAIGGYAIYRSFAVGNCPTLITDTPVPGYCSGTTYYVSTTGSDSNPGTQASPFRTIERAASLVVGGDVVLVADGTYTDTNSDRKIVNLTRGGSSSNWVVFKSINKDGAKLDGLNNTAYNGFVFNSNIGYVRLEGFEISGMGNVGAPTGSASGVEIYNGGHDTQIVGNNIHDVGRLCVNSGNTNGETGIFLEQPNVVIENNTIHDIGRYAPGENGCTQSTQYYQNHDHGIYVDGDAPGSNGAMIRNNLFYNMKRGWAIQLYPGTLSNVNVLNNSFASGNPYRSYEFIVMSANFSNANIKNNIFYDPSGGKTIENGGGTWSSVAVANNITSGNAMFDTPPSGGTTQTNNQLNTSAQMVNPPTDFHLQSTSPAINAGQALSNVTIDFAANTRPQSTAYDIGAYEYTGTICTKTLASGGNLQTFFNTLVPGDTACIHGGTYNQEPAIDDGGTPSSWVTITNYPGEQVIIKPTPGQPSGDHYPLRVHSSASYVRIKGLILDGSYAVDCSSTNFYVVGATHDIDLVGSELRNSTGGSAVYLDEPSSHIRIIGNLIHDNVDLKDCSGTQAHGIYIEGSDQLAANNVIYNHTEGWGIQMYDNGARNVAEGNTIVDNALGGIVLGGASYPDAKVINNIIAYNGGYGVTRSGTAATNCIIRSNDFYSNSSGTIESGFPSSCILSPNITTSPMFVSRTGHDYHLSTGSLAINVAESGYVYSPDYDGVTRPQGPASDLGAFEYTGSTSNCTSTASPGDNLSTFENGLAPGDIGCLHGGTYTGGFNFTRSGTSASPITIQSYPGETAILEAPYSSSCRNVLQLSNVSYLTLKNLLIRRANAGAGLATCDNFTNLYLNGSTNHVTVSDNEIADSHDHGVFCDDTTADNQILRNKVHNNGTIGGTNNADHAIYCEGSRNIIASNLVYDQPNGHAIQIYPSANGTIVAQNTVVATICASPCNNTASPLTAGIIVGSETNCGVVNVRLVNNIVYGNSRGIYGYGTCGDGSNQAFGNVIFNNPTCNTCNDSTSSPTIVFSANTIADPLFVAYSSRNLHLQIGPPISPGIDSATTGYIYSPDVEGTTRPQGVASDIGAYETSSGSSDSQPPTVSITAPAGGATVSGTITVSANASDNVGVVGVQFKLDGANLSSEDTSSPYSISWNTTTASNGSHSLTAVARDAAGNSTTSSTVTVTVNNTSIPGDCNADGHVTIIDLSILLSHYGQNYSACDFNFDNVVNVFDLSILLSHYGT